MPYTIYMAPSIVYTAAQAISLLPKALALPYPETLKAHLEVPHLAAQPVALQLVPSLPSLACAPLLVQDCLHRLQLCHACSVLELLDIFSELPGFPIESSGVLGRLLGL